MSPNAQLFCKLPTRKRPAPDISRGLGQNQRARDIVALSEYIAESMQLMVHKKRLYVYSPPCWSPTDKDEAIVRIREVLAKGDVDKYLTDKEHQAILRRLMTDPALQHRSELSPPEYVVNFLDGTFDLLSGQLYEHDPEDYLTFSLKIRYNDVQNAPFGKNFERFAANIGNGNAVVRRQLLEAILLAISGMQLKYFFALLGESNTGKTQFGRFLEELVGREHVASISSISDLGENWTSGEVEGKKLVTCLDLSNEVLRGNAVSQLKQLVGDDSVKARNRYRDSFTFYRKPLLVFAGNHPIQLRNLSNEQAFLNRMVVIPFANPYTGKSVQQFFRVLLKETPYIVAEALKVFPDLYKRNFDITRSNIPMEYQPTEGSSTVRDVKKMIDAQCVWGEDYEVKTSDLYEAYCQQTAVAPLSKIAYSRALATVLEGTTARPLKRAAGTEDRGYAGLKLKNIS